MTTSVGGDMEGESSFTAASSASELSPRSAVLGRKVHERLPPDASLRLDCVTAGRGARTVYTPPRKARVHVISGSGECGWDATRAGVKHCVGQTRTPSLEGMRTMVVSGAITHALGEHAPPKADPAAVLSKEQFARVRSLGVTELNSAMGVTKTELAVNERTHEWFHDCVQQRVTLKSFDVAWLALIAEGLGVNVMVWEPSGVDQQIQPLKAGSRPGLFMCGNMDNTGEAGDRWVHLLYRSSADPWAVRADLSTAEGGSTNDHFDWLQLGSDAAESFVRTIDNAQQHLQDGDKPSTAEATDRVKPRGRASAGAPASAGSGKIDVEGREKLHPTEKKRKAAAVDGRGKGGIAAGKKREKMDEKVTRAPPDETSGDAEAVYGSDEGVGIGVVDHLNTGGAFAGSTGDERQLLQEAEEEKRRRRTKRLEDSARQRSVNRQQQPGKGPGRSRQEEGNRTERTKGKGKAKRETGLDEEGKQEQEKEEQDNGCQRVEWSTEGIPIDVGSDVYKSRQQRSGGSACSLSASARERLPSLDDFITTLDANTGKWPMENVVLTTFRMVFPQEAVRLLLDKTNGYVNFCTTKPPKGEPDPRTPHQASKKRTLGNITLSDPAFEEKHIYGMLGLTMTMRLVRTTHMGAHWSLDPFDDYPLVRRCMQENMFRLLYCRFIHCSDGNAPNRLLPNGELNPAFDSKWHIRMLEDILNKAWVENVDINQWLCYNQQKIPTSSPEGIRCWGLCDIVGYRLTTSVDVGMEDDPNLRQWSDCPLGGTTRQVLWVMLGACKELKEKLDGSGVFIAMDKSVASPVLFEALASHKIYAVGSCPASRTGGALQYWESLDLIGENRGDIMFARSGEMAFVRWPRSAASVLCSTIHIFQPGKGDADSAVGHCGSQPNTTHEKGREGHPEQHLKPQAHRDYAANTRRITPADGRNNHCIDDDDSPKNDWRNVMESKFGQCFTNAFLLFKKWVALLKSEVESKLRNKEEDVTDVDVWEKALKELGRLAKVERTTWDRKLATVLMGMCDAGKAGKGRKPTGRSR